MAAIARARQRAAGHTSRKRNDMLAPTTTTDTTHLPWAELFLAQIRAGETVEQASTAAGVTRSWAYTCRAENEAFRTAWEAAVAETRLQLDWRPVLGVFAPPPKKVQ